MNQRSDAFIRVWYPGPNDLNQAKTSSSTFMVMVFLGGWGVLVSNVGSFMACHAWGNDAAMKAQMH